jgi:DNA-binding NarL/FixJ family response regulator
MPRILVADDHPGVRRFVRQVLESEQGWEVCGEAANGREAVAMTAAKRPDFVVLDVSMPELNGLQAARLIHTQFPEMELFILTMHDAAELMDEALASGVRDCILKTDLHDLVTAVRKIWQQTMSYADDDTEDDELPKAS